MNTTAQSVAANMSTSTPALPVSLPTHGVICTIPFRVAVSIAVPGMKLRGLRELKVGQVLHTATSVTEDVPVRAGNVLLGYAELDNLDGQMSVRLTRLN